MARFQERKKPLFLATGVRCGYGFSVNPQEHQQSRAWVAAWQKNAVVLEEVREQELRALTEEESGRVFAEMAVDTDTVWISPERADSLGLIEQQRFFMRSDEHPARHQRRP